MKKVIVYGTFDYFHYGHYNFLKQAKALGDYLIVGVSSDELCLKKGKKCLLSQEDRMEIIKNIKFVDDVILEDSFDQKIQDVIKYNINIYADGEDYRDIFPLTEMYNKIKDTCEVIFLHRTPGVSTTALKETLREQAELDTDIASMHHITDEIRKAKF